MPGLKPDFHDTFLPPLLRTAAVYSTGAVGQPGYANWVIALVHVTAGAGTTHTLDIAIQTSPDNSTWTTVASGSQITATTQSQMVVGYVGTDEYAQIIATVGGTGSPSKTFALGGLILS